MYRHQQLEETMNDLLSPSPLPFGKDSLLKDTEKLPTFNENQEI